LWFKKIRFYKSPTHARTFAASKSVPRRQSSIVSASRTLRKDFTEQPNCDQKAQKGDSSNRHVLMLEISDISSVPSTGLLKRRMHKRHIPVVFTGRGFTDDVRHAT